MPSDTLALPLDVPLGDARYARLWAASPQRSPFSHPAAVRAFGAAFGFETYVLAVAGASGELTAAVPVFEKRRGPFVASALPPLCPVHTPLLAATPTEAETHGRGTPLDALLAALAARYAQATLQLAPTLPDVRPLAWAGWTVTPRSTYVVPLGAAGDVLGAFSPTTRRLAQQNAMAYTVAEDPAFVADAVALTEASYRRQGLTSPVAPGVVAALVTAMADAGQVRVVAATRGGVAEAVVALATDGRTAAHWIAGSLPGPAMAVLLGSLLPRLAAEGIVSVDLCGANLPTVAEFKRKFGGVLSSAPRATVVTSRALRLAARLRP